MRSSVWLSPTAFLGVLFFIGNAGLAVAAAYSMPLRSGFLFLYFLGVQWALAWWVLVDCRDRGIPVSIDHGWFVFFAWPVVFPYHLLRTRGARGCMVIAGILGLFVAAYLLALALFFAIVR